VIIGDNANIAFNTTTGTKIGTATTQKLSFWNATPIVQPTTAVASGTLAINSTAQPVYAATTYDGYTTQQVVRALRNVGILA
jgi:Zn-dependent metalloprotease